MDSLTQITFGAALGEAILGHKVGRKALVWGAALGTLPDLDVFIPLGGPVDNFVYHRGFSHSLFLLALISPIIAWFITRIHTQTKQYYRQWAILSFIVLETSVLLDLFTVYGTQIFWPFDTTPMAVPFFFIIDPLFTLPILSGVITVIVLKRNQTLGHKINRIGLAVSLAYLVWAFGTGMFVEHRVKEKLALQKVSYSHLISSPAPFTTLLWRIVGVENDRYFETYFSLFDGETPLNVNFYPRNMKLMEGIEGHPPVLKLKWFTRGFYAFSKLENYVVMTDLRMGLEPVYVFQFKVARFIDSRPVPVKDQRVETAQDWRLLSWVWDRIWNT